MNALERLPLATKDGRGNMIRAFKASGCRKCGRRYPELDWSELHVDHLDPRDKTRSFAGMKAAQGGGGVASQFSSRGYEALLTELLLCQVLCFDCHKEKHQGAGAMEGQLSMFNGTGGWRYG